MSATEAHVPTLFVGPFTFDQLRGRLSRGTESVMLTRLQGRIFTVLAESNGNVVRHEDLYRRVWLDEGQSPEPKIINVEMHHIRKRLRALGGNSEQYLDTIWGVGYRLLLEPNMPVLPLSRGKWKELHSKKKPVTKELSRLRSTS